MKATAPGWTDRKGVEHAATSVRSTGTEWELTCRCVTVLREHLDAVGAR